MILNKLASNNGIFNPDDLALLRSVYEEAIALDPALADQPEHVAQRLMRFSLTGRSNDFSCLRRLRVAHRQISMMRNSNKQILEQLGG